jgi:hypothetical protein
MWVGVFSRSVKWATDVEKHIVLQPILSIRQGKAS